MSGSAALLRQRFPQESAAQIIHRLEVTASRPQRDARDEPQALDLTPVPDPNADQRQTTLWLLLGTGSTVLALGMWGMIRRARRETERA